jgi:hypothetical protein
MTHEQIAKVAHETNRAYCTAIGDFSQFSWEDSPEWQKQSLIAGVNFIANNPTSGPNHSHESWLKEKELEGWVYGPVKDPVKRQHPCMVPYDQLPKEQQAKDYIFGAVVRSLLPYLENANQ